MPENFDQSAMDFLAARGHTANMELNYASNRGPASVGIAPTPFYKFSPMMAAKSEELKKLAKSPLTVNAFSADTLADKKDENTVESLDFQVAGKRSEELKSLCDKASANSVTVYNNYTHCEWLTAPVSTETKTPPISLQVDGELKVGESVSVVVDSFDKTAGSDLLVEWNVQFRGNKILTSNSSTLTLANLKSGYYLVTAQVGGTQEEKISLIVE